MYPQKPPSPSIFLDSLQKIEMRGKKIQKLLTFLLILAVILFGISFFMKGTLPHKNNILPELFEEPVQTNFSEDEFSFPYRGVDYFVKPFARYQLSGLVVSHNDIHSITDMYHDKNSVDTKDLCVVWGENIQNESYLETKIWNQSWTCFFQYGAGVPFHQFQLSNNHLITDDVSIRNIIDTVHIGDQIRISGKLVDYGEKSGKYYRISSDTRTDTNETARGGGACEVIFVEGIEILQRATPLWYSVKRLSVRIIPLLLLLKVFVLVWEARIRKKYTERIYAKKKKYYR